MQGYEMIRNEGYIMVLNLGKNEMDRRSWNNYQNIYLMGKLNRMEIPTNIWVWK